MRQKNRQPIFTNALTCRRIILMVELLKTTNLFLLDAHWHNQYAVYCVTRLLGRD